VLPGEPDLARLGSLDPDRDHELLKRGERAWVLQTYLRLAAAGLPVELTGEMPADGLVVFHAKHWRWVRKRCPAGRATVLVGIRGSDVDQAIAAVERLLSEPGLFRAMTDRCAERAAELTPGYWLDAWTALLFDPRPRQADAVLAGRLRALPLRVHSEMRRLGRWLAGG
jgi:hypothetical protein